MGGRVAIASKTTALTMVMALSWDTDTIHLLQRGLETRYRMTRTVLFFTPPRVFADQGFGRRRLTRRA
jgi:hypothetical protein